MSLVTIQRSQASLDAIDSSNNNNYVGIDNQNEDFFALKTIVVLQNGMGRRDSSIIKEGDLMQHDLVISVGLLRKEDKLGMMVSLEKVNSKIEGFRYFCVIVTNGAHNTEEYLIIGVDISFKKATIGFVLPICQDMSVSLDGDGGFIVKYKDGEKLFKPSSVLALWSTVNVLNKACSIAHKHNYYIGGLSHSWVEFYTSRISSNRAQIAEWNRMLHADTGINSSLAPKSAIGEFVFGTFVDENIKMKDEIRRHLTEIMRGENMDSVTVVSLREKLQERVEFNLKEYRSFVAETILIIYGQMDSPTEILPYLYLGSSYNASNLEELQNNNITHIINVTKETSKFFEELFFYKNVYVFDEEHSNLLSYFNDCYQFINEARDGNSACLVHCQRGISRSATVVIAYLMKEFNWSRDKALDDVKCKRTCILPNNGFMLQLKTYEGILKASGHRHNKQFNEDKRNQINSFPSDSYRIQEENLEVPQPRKATSQYDQSISDSMIEQSTSSTTRISSLLVADNSHCGCTDQSSYITEKADVDEVLPTSKNISGDTNSYECTLESIENSSKCQEVDPAKPLLRLKGDASWIKDCTVEMQDTTTLQCRKHHSVDMALTFDCEKDDGTDKYSLRPIKELLTRYSNS